MEEEKKEDDEPYLIPSDDSFDSKTMLEADVGVVLESEISTKKDGPNNSKALFLLALPQGKKCIKFDE